MSNGEVEVINRTIFHCLKTRFTDAKGLWAEELQSILWAYRATHQISTREILFKLTYGTEATILVEVGLLFDRVRNFHEITNSDRLRTDLDLFDEVREQAHIRMVAYKQRVVKYYNAHVKMKSFQKDDLVLRRAEVSRPTE